MIGQAAFANLRRKPAGVIPSPPAPVVWDYTGSGTTPALTIDSGWPNPAIVDGLNIKQTGDGAPAIRIVANRQVIIRNCRIEHTGRGIETTVTITSAEIRNNTLHGVNPDTNGVGADRYHINLQSPVHTIENNSFYGGGSGIYINGVNQTANTLKIRYNLARNLRDTISNGTGLPGLNGYLPQTTPTMNKWTAHFIVFNSVTAPGGDISWNHFYNEAPEQLDFDNDDWGSMNSDIINMYKTKGALGNPLTVANNCLSGSFISQYWASGAGSGTAIITESPAAGDCQYIEVTRNYCARVQNIAIYSHNFADNCNITYNYIACSGKLKGIWMYDTNNQPLYGDSGRTNCAMSYNTIWKVPDVPPPATAHGTGRYYYGSANGSINGNTTTGNVQAGVATEADEANILVMWEAWRVSQSAPAPGSSIPPWW